MSVLQEVLKEEIERLQRNISHYENIISKLPKGCIFIRKIGNSSYAYRKRKEKGKVISVYLGNIECEYTQQQIQLTEEYKRIQHNIKVSKSELLKLKKAYSVYER